MSVLKDKLPKHFHFRVDDLEKDLGGMEAASARFNDCLLRTVDWRGRLNEDTYQNKIGRLKSDGNLKAAELLENARRSVRLAYFGWRLASFAALLDLQYWTHEQLYNGKELRNAQRNPDNEDALARIDAEFELRTAEIIKSVFNGSSKANPAAMLEDWTAGAGSDALYSIYNEFNRGSDLTYLPWPATAMQRNQLGPLTFIGWHECKNPLVGPHLLPEFQKLFVETPVGEPLDLAGMASLSYSQLNEEQFSERRAAEKPFTRSQAFRLLSLEQHYKRIRYLKLVDCLGEYVKQLEAFKKRLDAFIVLHRDHQLGLCAIESEFERRAAMYNLISATAFAKNISEILVALKKEMRKHRSRYQDVKAHSSHPLFSPVIELSGGLDGLLSADSTDRLVTATKDQIDRMFRR